MRTDSERENYDTFQTEFQKKTFIRYTVTNFQPLANIGYIEVPINETGWYVISVRNGNSIWFGSSKTVNQPATPLYPHTNNLIWLDKDERCYIQGTPNDFFDIGFYGMHKPDIHDDNAVSQGGLNVTATEAAPLNVQPLEEIVVEDIITIKTTTDEKIVLFAERISTPV